MVTSCCIYEYVAFIVCFGLLAGSYDNFLCVMMIIYGIKHHVSFQPFVIEEFGAVHKEGMNIFNRLCEFIAIRPNKDVTKIKFHYSKSLSSAIKRQNSRAILSRLCQ